MGNKKKSTRLKQKQKQSVIVNVYGEQKKKGSKKRKSSRKTSTDEPIIVHPIYQSIMAPQAMMPHNVLETNGQAQRQNFQNQINHEQGMLSLTNPQHIDNIAEIANHLRETLGLTNKVRAYRINTYQNR